MALALAWLAAVGVLCAGFLGVPVQPQAAPAIIGLLLALWLETRAAPLEPGNLSPAPVWTLSLLAVPGMSLAWVMICLVVAGLLRSFTRTASGWGAQRDLLIDFLPSGLALLACARLQGWALLPVVTALQLLGPWLLQYLLLPKTGAPPSGGPMMERLSLATLGLLGQQVAPQHPLLLLLLLPASLALIRSSETGSELQQRRAQHQEVRQARRAVQFQQQVLGEAELRQQAQQRLLDARAETFVLLEGLSVRADSRAQALQEALAMLKARLSGAEVLYLRESEIQDPGIRRLAHSQETWVSPDATQATWPVAPDGLVWLRSPRPLNPEVGQALQVFFYYLQLLLERVDHQQALRQALDSEASMRQQLAAAVNRLEAILEGASRLTGLVQPREIIDVLLERAEIWTGRACSWRSEGLELGSWSPELAVIRLPAGAQFGIDSAGLTPADFESLRIWLLLGEAALLRCQAQAALHQGSKLAAVGQLAAGLAHELNTPLGSVSMALGLALANLGKDPEKARVRLEKAYEALDQMRDILARLLQYARESEGEQRRLDLGQLARDAVAFAANAFQQASVDLLLTIHAADIAVVGNGGELQQVLMNLLSNARLACQATETPQVRLQVGRAEGQGFVEVDDNGPGVPEEIVERIFEPFFTSREVGQGLGLGLSTSREIARSHQGALTYTGRSDLGGARFRLTLPLDSSKEQGP